LQPANKLHTASTLSGLKTKNEKMRDVLRSQGSPI
jgi:hypothetical protein